VSPTSIPPTPTPEIISIFLDPNLPADYLRQVKIPEGFIKNQSPDNSKLQVKVASGNSITSWVYALVAPFPTVEDGIALTTLKELWEKGEIVDFPSKKLLVDAETLKMFKQSWGQPSTSVVEMSAAGLVGNAWSMHNAWAIIPFDQLEPRWKVLEVDGISPIQRNFDPAKYGLTVNISLQGDTGLVDQVLADHQPGSDTALAPLSNRDATKLTTINMTGVTAMVRGTAGLMMLKGITYPANQIRDILKDADFVHISNEIPYTPKCPNPVFPVSSELVFCSKPEYNQLLEDVGANIIELSGDHFQDWGPDAMVYTLDLYKKSGWKYYGGGYNIEDGKKPLLLEHNGNKIAFIGCNAKPKGYAGASDTNPGAVHCDFDYVTDQIKKVKSEGYIPITTFQDVEYYGYEARDPLITNFHMVADAGSEIVSGSQGHQPQAVEFVGSQLLHYGLGNLFFDQYHEGYPTRQAFIDRHVFYNGKYISTQLISIIFIDNAQSRLMTHEERMDLLQTIFKASGW
jgi:poly-gamma-glutamate synthesis protein (capsule biosynthesis protein)